VSKDGVLGADREQSHGSSRGQIAEQEGMDFSNVTIKNISFLGRA
jgi:hypothetical protein